MSTAGRPTFHSAVGKSTFGGVRSRMVCVRDQTANTKMKFRQFGQGSVEELKNKDFREDIDAREEAQLSEHNKAMALITEAESKVDVPLLLKNQPEIDHEALQKYDDADVDNQSDDGFDSSSDEDEDEDDDEAELQAELQRIREERAAAQEKKLREEQEATERSERDNALRGNPLLNASLDDSAKIKRRWNDDVVFRNQTKDEPQVKKRFINDTIRSDFHRSFLKKFVQ